MTSSAGRPWEIPRPTTPGNRRDKVIVYDPHGWPVTGGPDPLPGACADWTQPQSGFSDGTFRQPPAPFSPLDTDWDPAEELAHLLQDAASTQEPPAASSEDAVSNDSLDGLVKLTTELPPVRSAGAGHRRAKARQHQLDLLQLASFLLAAVTAVIVSMVSVYGGMVAYAPLRHIAQPHTPTGALRWWPLLVYGPWMVASLSILRAALHQRRAVHSWSVVLLFSTLAMLLCVAQAPRTLTDVAAAALPSLAALTCFQQVVRQITLTRPPRKTTPRHRTPAPAPPTTATLHQPTRDSTGPPGAVPGPRREKPHRNQG
ncbi:DUF2637 domain-containing protein [Streptomyces sp. NPDC015346]|uniref:DUF2637 domain-containing protein n=1 Tax=Streptomyces sp. NPDC015346 TaxID=3364954 RepID=UPI0036F74C14